MNNKIFDPTFRDRILSKIDRQGDSDCWPWLGATDGDGYGYFKIGKSGSEKAHRAAYALAYGDFERRLCICHHCDNRICCNPAHLFKGTRADNNRDRDQKGRGSDKRGEKNGNSRVTRKQVDEIRVLVANGRSQQSVANEYGIKQPQISRIIRLEQWRD